jgi:nitrate reductase gamma subunit
MEIVFFGILAYFIFGFTYGAVAVSRFNSRSPTWHNASEKQLKLAMLVLLSMCMAFWPLFLIDGLRGIKL